MNEVNKCGKQILNQDVYQHLRLRLKALQQMGGQLEEENSGFS